MGIFKKYKNIMENKLDPSSHLDRRAKQYLENLNQDLGKIKSETATVIAEEQRAKRALDECRSEIRKMDRYAKKASDAGDAEKARSFLDKKSNLMIKEAELEEIANSAMSNTIKMKQMHQKVVSDIAELEDMLRGNSFEDLTDIEK